jgi:hypothetical protein
LQNNVLAASQDSLPCGSRASDFNDRSCTPKLLTSTLPYLFGAHTTLKSKQKQQIRR